MSREQTNTDPRICLAEAEEIVRVAGSSRDRVIRILQLIQQRYRYLPEPVLRRVCELSEATPAQITGVASFYSQFRHRPVGKHIIRVCHGTACHVKGSVLIHDALYRCLAIPEGNDTDPEGLFTVEKVACLGCCTLAPVMQIGDIVYGHLTPDRVPHVLRDFLEQDKQRPTARRRRPVLERRDGVAEIRIGLGSCCVSKGSALVKEALEDAITRSGAQAVVKRVGCVGMCHQTPLVEVVIPGERPILYARVQPRDAKAIVARHFPAAGVIRKLDRAVSNLLDRLVTDEAWKPVTRYSIDFRDAPVASFLGGQVRLATEHCGYLDPEDLDEYIRHDGFKALSLCLDRLTPEAVIEQVRQSGLRGRGGAGFPTGAKWATVLSASSDVKYVICNGDEGDPGAFMDRMILESFPYRVIEGMAIAAFAVGAEEGILYIRAEYPLAVQRVQEALEHCEERGFLGENVLGKGRRLRFRIFEGAGAFVCGEETAMLASIEGKRGMPRSRPPFPAENGLRGKPTLINNVETYALVPWIIRNGAAAFASQGTERSKGTKVFALAGKVARGGLVEVPMGITLRQIVEGVGGGIAGAGKFKAVLVGGPSGGCVPAELGETPVDYEALTSVGAMMGSGGLVVLDDSDCAVDIARYFLQFTQSESCGKCTFCRIGTRRMLDILDALCEGKAGEDALEELQNLARTVKEASLCGLGKTAPNPVLTTLRYFRAEYEAHLQGRCPAGRCKALIAYEVTDDCIGCTLCAQNCPSGAVQAKPYEKHLIDVEKCVRCGMCRITCPEKAIRIGNAPLKDARTGPKRKPATIYRISDDCIGCTLCAQKCPARAIKPRPCEKHEIDQERCIRCGLCKKICPHGAVEAK